MFSSDQSPGAVPAVAGVIAIAVFAMALLRIHDQWGLLALGVIACIALLMAVRTGAAAHFERAFATHERLMNGVVIIAFLGVIAVLAREDFSLLILSTVLLYCVACMGLSVQLGYCGVMNFAGAAFFGAGAYTAAVVGGHTTRSHGHTGSTISTPAATSPPDRRWRSSSSNRLRSPMSRSSTGVTSDGATPLRCR